MELGIWQSLLCVRKVEFGVYLAERQDAPREERVLLPIRQVPEKLEVGDPIDVFLYCDSGDRLIATVKEPLIVKGQIARLKVVEVGRVGAFLDWGLEKDLLLPFKEQTRKVAAGEECLVALYTDKSGRLCATMNVYEYLEKNSPYKKDDTVQGTVYETSERFGVFVAVDDRYCALIPAKECYGKAGIRIGDTITARVTAVKEDGKLDLSIREKAYLQIEKDAGLILKAIDAAGGALGFNDKASPELIRQEMDMSKSEFKRAVGHLLKTGEIEQDEDGIRRREKR
ncbi:MAG: S1-like domain-containing RNA-binding protein [Clostridium sp.]|nr:S1-like domain-containing RNA-binding protein [Clostridium sp.]